MNTLFQKITTGLVLALSVSLTSCEKDSLLTPNPAGSARSGAAKNDIVVGIPQVHKLTRYGDATLTYADNGRLLNVTTPVRGSLSIQTDYTYSPGTIRAFSHQGKIILHDETFTLDASGRCTESVEAGAYSDIHWIFHYTDKGQLWSIYNKNSCVGGISYTYNTDGDMIQATLATSPSDGLDITFAYNKPTNASVLDDKYPLTVSVPRMAAHDTYLRIFGKPSKHLLKQVSYEPSGNAAFPSPSDLNFSYTLDAEGYVTKKTEYNGQSGVLPKATLYEYVVSNITLYP